MLRRTVLYRQYTWHVPIKIYSNRNRSTAVMDNRAGFPINLAKKATIVKSVVREECI